MTSPLVEEARRLAETMPPLSFPSNPELAAPGSHKWIARARDLLPKLAEENEALRENAAQALRFIESYLDAADPDPREDDGEEMSNQDAYVLSARDTLREVLTDSHRSGGGTKQDPERLARRVEELEGAIQTALDLKSSHDLDRGRVVHLIRNPQARALLSEALQPSEERE